MHLSREAIIRHIIPSYPLNTDNTMIQVSSAIWWHYIRADKEHNTLWPILLHHIRVDRSMIHYVLFYSIILNPTKIIHCGPYHGITSEQTKSMMHYGTIMKLHCPRHLQENVTNIKSGSTWGAVKPGPNRKNVIEFNEAVCGLPVCGLLWV